MAKPKKDQERDQSPTIDIYLLAAEQDESICRALKKHLTGIIRNSAVPIEIRSDFDIPPGHDIETYKNRLYEAEIVLAFISVDFIDDNSCYNRAKKVIERYNNNKTKLLPILTRNCLWKSSQFKNLQLLPQEEKPIKNRQFWDSEDDALTLIAEEVNNRISSYNLRGSSERIHTLNPDSPANIGTLPNGKIKTSWRFQYYLNIIGRRIGAYFIDIIVTILLYLLLYMAWIKIGMNPELASDDILGHVIFFGLPTLLLVIICAGLETSKWQGTFGKMILRMQTTDGVGNRISFLRALWRNCLRFVFGGMWILIILEIIRYLMLDKSLDNKVNYQLILLLAVLTFLIQLIYFLDTKKVIHDVISGTQVGEQLSRSEKK